jgi:ABC-type transport system involved in cytochrome c biogenesis ATPase subunit
MKIHSLAATDFLSFSSLQLPLQAGTTIVTGPNGAGKSNLSTAIALPLLILQLGLKAAPVSPDSLDLYQDAGHNGADSYSVDLDIELDQPWEQDLVRMFIEAAVATNAIEQMTSSTTDQSRNGILSLFTRLPVAADSVDSLLRGTLRVAYSARHSGLWWAAWNFRHAEEDFQLILKGNGPGRLHRGHYEPWIDGSVAGFQHVVPPLGYTPSTSTVGQTHQSLTAVLRQEHSARAGKPQPAAIDFSLMLQSLDQQGAFAMEVKGSNVGPVEPVSVGTLRRALGFTDQDRNSRSIHFDFRHVLAQVLQRGLVLTNNRRLPLSRHFPVNTLSQPVDLRDGSGVAAELYRLKNGNHAQQQRYQKAASVFHAITNMDMLLRSQPTDEATIEIDVLVGDGEAARVAQFSGAGIQEALLLSTLVTGDPGRIAVLDEPAVNLHPTVQRRLARHLADVQGIVITHSPDLVPCDSIEDLNRVVRLTPSPTGTQVRSLPEHRRKRLDEWLQKLLLTDVRALLFASGVILCEGATEVGALGQWWKDGASTYTDPAAANITLIDVGGDNNFGGYINYLEAFGIPWAAVADGPAFLPKSGLSKQLRNQGLAAGQEPDTDADFEFWRRYWNQAGIFTLADGFGSDPEKSGEFEAFLERENKDLLEKTSKEHSKSKPRIGAAFAQASPMPKQVAALYQQIREHLTAPRPPAPPSDSDSDAPAPDGRN